ncbi:MAG TPA: 50S ribosomal protein L3 [Candidatus Deferrimicrobium sp.]|nr:50S ribosomal protein L3 [Candidatus Deferrimicrobium sp.]
MKEILGRKLGMTRIFSDTGEVIPVTVIEAGPCPVVARKTVPNHGYAAYQVGFGKRRKSHVTKPYAGHFAKAKVEPAQYVREIRFDDSELQVGASVTVDAFAEGDRISVSGISRGLGFAGVMKRHNFSGAQITHGQSDRQRAPGSLGQSSYPSRVFKGMRMAGRMGNEKVTVLNLQIVKIIAGENLMLVKGAVPGNKGSLVKVRTTGRGSR